MSDIIRLTLSCKAEESRDVSSRSRSVCLYLRRSVLSSLDLEPFHFLIASVLRLHVSRVRCSRVRQGV